MVIYLEDCLDDLQVLYPQYDFFFLLTTPGAMTDKEDGLNVGNKLEIPQCNSIKVTLVNTHLSCNQGMSTSFQAKGWGAFWIY